jgi:serine O-acetyltransferase
MAVPSRPPLDGLRRRWRALLAAPHTEDTERLWQDVRDRHPRFGTAVVADARITAAYRGDRFEFTSKLDAVLQVLRLAVVTDAFLALCCYRAKAHCLARRIPVLPRLLHHLAIVIGQVSIGDPVVVQPGVYVPHGQVVVDGIVEIGPGAVLMPFVTIGLRHGDVSGPRIGARATIGTGAKVLGPVHVGDSAQIGANAVVLSDVPAHATAVGVPARVVTDATGR